MNYKLKKAVASDIDFIYPLHKQSNFPHIENTWGWDENYQWNELEFGISEGGYSIIEHQDQQVGFIETNELPNEVHLCELHLLECVRGKGLGRRIIKDLIRETAKSCKTVKTGCFKENDRARKLYEHLGFEVIDESFTHFIMEYRVEGK